MQNLTLEGVHPRVSLLLNVDFSAIIWVLQPTPLLWGTASIYASESIVSGDYFASVAGTIGGSDERIKERNS